MARFDGQPITYDENGKLYGFNYKAGSDTIDTNYEYIRNAKNDIIGIIDKNGVEVVTYLYDTWGKLISTKEYR